jgi:hypothetical protein
MGMGRRPPGSDDASACVVTVSEEGVSCTRPSGLVESVAWDDLQAVVVETNDLGPFLPDVFWVLAGRNGGCVVPQGATGGDRLLEMLQALPGFDNEQFIAAMGSTSNQTFVCWRRAGGPQQSGGAEG